MLVNQAQERAMGFSMNTVKFVVQSWSLVAVIGASAILAAASQASPGSDAQDKMFIVQSAEGSLAEVELGKLALKKSQDPEVKQFAQKMIEDHTKLIEDMKPIADEMGVKPPMQVNDKHRQEAEHLSGLSGQQFDGEYITAMVADHHHDLNEFIAEESRTQNLTLKSIVAKGREVIHMHTEMIDEIARKKAIQAPGLLALVHAVRDVIDCDSDQLRSDDGRTA
jgi:putative membrane protein